MLDNKITQFLSKSLWVALVLFVARCFLWSCNSLYDYISAAGEVITCTLIIMGIYSGILWKYNPLEKAPKLMGKYKGVIEYNFNGTEAEKNTSVEITQTLFSIKIQITTDEITSKTIVGNLVEENGEYVLYYTYITNPKCKYSKDNPIQYGTCRLLTSNVNCLSGTYWTSRQTIGDIELRRIADK